jgi:hypothetical protein
MAAHLGGEGMGRVDHMRDGFAADEVGQTLRAAEAANAGRQRMGQRNFGAAGIGIDRVDLRAKESVGEAVGIACSAENERARHE